jgi:hypothetical protein
MGSTIISHRNTDGVIVDNVYAVDDGYGKINLVTTDSTGTQSLVYPNIGVVDYANGTIKFNTAFAPTSSTVLFTVTVQPQNTDIFVFENKILRVSRGYPDSVRISLQSQTSRKQNLKG